MTKKITIEIADNGVLIDSKDMYSDGEVSQGEHLVFLFDDSPQDKDERKKTIEQMGEILHHLSGELGYSYDKHSEHNLLIDDDANIEHLYKDQQVIFAECTICKKQFNPSEQLLLNLNMKEKEFVCSPECFSELKNKNNKKKENQ